MANVSKRLGVKPLHLCIVPAKKNPDPGRSRNRNRSSFSPAREKENEKEERERAHNWNVMDAGQVAMAHRSTKPTVAELR
jgi:hypothetical protein